MEKFSGDLAGRGLEVVSDAICPWCYVGKRRLAKALTLLAQDGLTFAVRWLPFQLNPDMPKGGIDRRAYRTRKFGSWERSQALDARVAAVGAGEGLAFRHDLMARTPNTFDARWSGWPGGRARRMLSWTACSPPTSSRAATSASRACSPRSAPRPGS